MVLNPYTILAHVVSAVSFKYCRLNYQIFVAGN